MSFELDHLVWGTPDVDAGCAEIEALLGVPPMPGGVHPSLGTRNALLSLGDGVYLEIIGPDGDELPSGSFGERLQSLHQPGLVTWVLRTGQLKEISARLSDEPSGLTPLGPIPTQRRTAEGDLLSWELLFLLLREHAFGGLVPFLIDWQDTPHPSVTSPQGGIFRGLNIHAPDPRDVNAAYAALGTDQRAHSGEQSGLEALIATETGNVRLTSTPETLSAWAF